MSSTIAAADAAGLLVAAWPQRQRQPAHDVPRSSPLPPSSSPLPPPPSSSLLNHHHPHGKRVIVNPFVDLLRHRKAMRIADDASPSSSHSDETFCAPLLQTPRVSQAPSTPPPMIRTRYRLKNVMMKRRLPQQQQAMLPPPPPPPPQPGCSPAAGYFTPRRTPRETTTSTDIC